MTRRYVLRPRARSDLRDIWAYTERHWGIDQADTYIQELRRRIEAVAAQPGLGQPSPDLRPGYYRCSAGSHVVFYRRTKTGVEVVRVLHARMDFGRHL